PFNYTASKKRPQLLSCGLFLMIYTFFVEYNNLVDCKFNPNALPNYERLSFLLDLLDLAKLSGPTQ
ncbi:hypothetical protein, partial [Lactiplantibacillus plantarum]|uniref:hypothetical protein n=1 Tax=Lactiplantibacillus plantarum TaxID=1590 RepID=UPI001C9D9F06